MVRPFTVPPPAEAARGGRQGARLGRWITTGPDTAAFEPESAASSAPRTSSRSPRARPRWSSPARDGPPPRGAGADADLTFCGAVRRSCTPGTDPSWSTSTRRRWCRTPRRSPRPRPRVRRRRRDGGPAPGGLSGGRRGARRGGGLPVEGWSRTPRTGRARGRRAARRVGRPGGLLQLLRHQEPAHRRGRHDHHRRRSCQPGPRGAAARDERARGGATCPAGAGGTTSSRPA